MGGVKIFFSVLPVPAWAQKADTGKMPNSPSHITAYTVEIPWIKWWMVTVLAIKISFHLQKQEKHIMNGWPLACQQLEMRILASSWRLLLEFIEEAYISSLTLAFIFSFRVYGSHDPVFLWVKCGRNKEQPHEPSSPATEERSPTALLWRAWQ